MTTQTESEFLGLQYDVAVKDKTTKFYKAKKDTMTIKDFLEKNPSFKQELIIKKIAKVLKLDTNKKIIKKVEPVPKYDKDKEDTLILESFRKNPYQYLPYEAKLNIIHKVHRRNIMFKEEKKIVNWYLRNKDEVDQIFETNYKIFTDNGIEFTYSKQSLYNDFVEKMYFKHNHISINTNLFK
jgi:hypothetical protein